MKNIYLIVSTVLFVALSMFSCRPKENVSAENGIQFDTIHTVKNYHINNDSTQPSCNLKLSFAYPAESSDKATLDSLQRIFISCFFDNTYMGLTPQEAVKSYENNYIESYKEDFRIFSQDRNEHDNTATYSSYYEIDNNEIIFNKAGIISFLITKTNYKGGASSFDFLKNYTIDLRTLQLIDEDDLFNEGYEKALNTVFRNYLLKSKNAKSLAELENIGYFGLDEMVPNGNFTLDDKGITYIFNKGEYSSLKTDPIKIFISYNDIAPLIRDDSPVFKFISM
ncbi:RsiV family protein [Dysgonomonas sp. OttesenSCG-928-M03]|nr:RsiV family protein [Dysgonomonas sp. OttesenSCG-928-M03]